jgi:aminoglycoside phosphotransferase (APT) family kinase protein
MNTPLWEADRKLTLDDARALIGARFPEVDSSELKHLGSGWEFDVFLTRDGWVFRFPRRAWCEGLFELERRPHALVAPALGPTIAVPEVELLGEPTEGFPYKFAGHRFIDGVPADKVDEDLLPNLTRGIGSALESVHSIPENVARSAGIVEPDLDEKGRREWLEKGVDLASRLRGLEPAIDSAVSWMLQLSLPLPVFYDKPCLIHYDLSPEHVLVDPTTGHLTGILDWTDAALGDAARDFVFLVTWRGWEFTDEVLSHYHVPLDNEFRERLSFMARFLSVIWLGEAQEQGADVTKHIEWVRNAST